MSDVQICSYAETGMRILCVNIYGPNNIALVTINNTKELSQPPRLYIYIATLASIHEAIRRLSFINIVRSLAEMALC